MEEFFFNEHKTMLLKYNKYRMFMASVIIILECSLFLEQNISQKLGAFMFDQTEVRE